MTGLEMGLGMVTAAATVVGTYVGLKIAPIEKDLLALEKALGEMHKDTKDEKDKLENRLQAIEKTYIDRAELNRAIEAFVAHSDKNTDRIEKIVIALGQKVDHLAERVVRVEGT